ncbi:hypothetical protein [Paludisphaera rhizosphaerae]|uniref:hypothetical protein n=1 Tax=Paludisphaera rhizosphaerae TaxID=2711216 RepID=UPI001981A408|nr:hypothetical protein [Paludisphaera rhizosphaerae]
MVKQQRERVSILVIGTDPYPGITEDTGIRVVEDVLLWNEAIAPVNTGRGVPEPSEFEAHTVFQVDPEFAFIHWVASSGLMIKNT